MEKFNDPKVFTDDFDIEINWQQSTDAILKDVVKRKVSKHFCTWL